MLHATSCQLTIVARETRACKSSDLFIAGGAMLAGGRRTLHHLLLTARPLPASGTCAHVRAHLQGKQIEQAIFVI